MSVELRILLLIMSILAVVYMARKISKSQMQLLDSIYWILVALVLAVFGIFPVVPTAMAKILHIDSPVNLVYLIMIFIVLLRCFLLTIRVSKMEARFQILVEELAVRKNMEKKEQSQI